MKNLKLLLLIILLAECRQKKQQFIVTSPDLNTTVYIESGKELTYSVSYLGKPVILKSKIALHLKDGNTAGSNPVIRDTVTTLVNDTIFPAVREKRSLIPDHYRQLIISLEGDFEVQFRIYNDGVAWRWATNRSDSIYIVNEVASFRANEGTTAYYPQVAKRPDADKFHTAFEEPYTRSRIDSIELRMLAFSPVLLQQSEGPLIVITESDVVDYPGMFLSSLTSGGFYASFPGYPLQETVSGGEFKQKIVTRRAPWICKTSGPRTFPWRVIAIAPEDRDLPGNDIVYRLASPPEHSDFSWVKPGKSTEEWITGLNLYGVDFRAGLNTATYKHYIDFARKFGFEYVMLDAGWSDPADLFKITPGMDMDSITGYAKESGKGLILWTEAMTLDRQMDSAMEQFRQWDVKIVMTDFIDRNDQVAMNFMHRVARICAENRFMCMIHGAPIPAGFSRTWPNMLAREGALGSEYNIWSAKANPEHDLQQPFIRMLAGPMDYEPGLLQNVGRDQTSKLGFEKVIAQGTLMHQIAMFVVYESPLQLFSGNLSDAQREPELMSFVGRIPTVWDETQIIDAKFGDYILEYRRNGNHWYVAAMNDWTARDFKVALDFLPPGIYDFELAADGINADRNAGDYRMERTTIKSGDKIKIHLAPGGGYVGLITQKTPNIEH